MKTNYVREIKRIVANYSLRKKATGYNINSRSSISKIIQDFIKFNWIDGKYYDGRFLFVSPSNNLKEALRKDETNNRPSSILALKKYLTGNRSVQDLHIKLQETIVK